jgi:hypothetical protein
MYLAQLQHGQQTTYQIRQSFPAEENRFQFRVLYDLGEHPGQFIDLFEDHIVIFDTRLLVAVSPFIKGDADLELERLLHDFLPPEVKKRQQLFQHRNGIHAGPLTGDDRKAIADQVHLFDRRRLYYLRYGAVDQSRLSRLHEKCCRPLLGQSRDEREYYFSAEEMALEPGSYLQYVYAIFNIQQYFHQSFATWLPEALAKEEMEDHFLKELCRLHDDSRFWQGSPPGYPLSHHLARYLIMFFDSTAAGRSFQSDFARSFMSGRRHFRWPDRGRSKGPEQVSRIFATPYDTLKKMSREDFSRLYRKKAMELHPDRGGDHDLFIELAEVYNQLLKTKQS